METNFNTFAKEWDTERRINRAKCIADEIRKSLSDRKNLNAMEFGCGTGLISFNLLNLYKNITLIDSSKKMIEVLNEKIKNQNIYNMNTYNLDITKDNKVVGKYDVIYSSMVLHHIINTKNILKKFYEGLNYNGELCIVDLNEEDGKFHKKELGFNGHNGFSQEKLKNLLIMVGFKDVKIKTFFSGQKVVGKNEIIDYSLFIVTGKK